MGITIIKNKITFKFPRCYQQNMFKREECKRHGGWRMNPRFSVALMTATFTAYCLFTLPSQSPPCAWESVCINGTEHQRTFQLQLTAVTVSVETMNHRHSTWDKLWQHLGRVTNVSCDMAVAMVRLHVQEMCEVSWKAPIHPRKFPMPMSVFWKLSAADNTVIGFLSGSLAGRNREEKSLGKLKKKKSITSPVSVCVGSKPWE